MTITVFGAKTNKSLTGWLESLPTSGKQAIRGFTSAGDQLREPVSQLREPVAQLREPGDQLRQNRGHEDAAHILQFRPRTATRRRPRLLQRFTKYISGLVKSEAGMATAEYAIATLAAVGFAGLLVVILRSEEVRGFLLNLIRTALSLP